MSASTLKRCARAALGAGLVSLCVAAPARAQANAGYGRAVREERVRMSKAELQSLLDAGKTPPQIDPATGEALRTTIQHVLPDGWLLQHPAGLAPGARIDSLGNPIVNDTPGLPAWAQRDVDALRATIVQWRDELARQRAQGRDTAETEAVLGNYLAQAITRAISIDDLANIDDAQLMTPGVAGAVVDYLHFYENVRFANQALFGYQYTTTQYPARIAAFVHTHGSELAIVQQIEPAGPVGRGGLPSGCYNRSTFARGITLLSGQTNIFNADGTDDAASDVPIGFDTFFFYACQDNDNNTSVRVSSNGYISFFEQGGGALAGTVFINDPIFSASDPDGFAAPWWDDLTVERAQGDPDRVSFKTEGAVDQRVFTVEYTSMSRRVGSTDDLHYFQVKLFETIDVVEFHYATDSLWLPDTLDNSTQGMENYDGTGGDCGTNCGNANSTPPQTNFRFAPLGRPSNDLCENASALAPGANTSGTLKGATADGTASCGSSNANRDVWFQYTALCAGTLRLSTCGSRDQGGPGAGVDTVLSVYSGCPGNAANQIACNDDGGTGCSTNDSLILLPLGALQNVKIRVSHFGDGVFRFGNGDFTLQCSFIPAGPSPNDFCANAFPLANHASILGSLACATNDARSTCNFEQFNNDVWYTFTAPFTGRLVVDTCGTRDRSGPGTGPDSIVSLYSSCPASLANQIACNDDADVLLAGCNRLDSRLPVILSANTTVRIRVTHFGSGGDEIGNGVFVLHTDFACVADINSDALVNSQDFFDFLTFFFADNLLADINLSGEVNSQDFFDFLSAFFAGC